MIHKPSSWPRRSPKRWASRFRSGAFRRYSARMEREAWHVEIRCAACRFATMLDPAGAASWLLAAGRLRTHSEATRDELRELAVALAPQIACTECGQLHLAASIVEDDPAVWPEARRCDDC